MIVARSAVAPAPAVEAVTAAVAPAVAAGIVAAATAAAEAVMAAVDAAAVEAAMVLAGTSHASVRSRHAPQVIVMIVT